MNEKFRNIFISYPITNLVLLLLPILHFIVGAKAEFIINVFLGFCVFMDQKKIVGSKYSWILLFLVFPLLWSFFLSLDSSTYIIIQSLFYLLTPLLMILVGIQISTIFSNLTILFKYIIYSGTIGSLIYIVVGIFKIGISGNIFVNAFLIRESFFWTSITNVLAIIILLFSHMYGFKLFKRNSLRYFLLAVNILALLLTASRTYYLIFFVILLLIFYNLKKKYFFSFLLIFLVGLGIVFNSTSENKMVKKIQTSSDEIFAEEENATYEFVNNNYRSYETQQAFKTFFAGDEIDFVFGHGYSKMIDLNIFVAIGGSDNYVRFIPITHNGYAYLLLRTGFAGLVCFLFFFSLLFYTKNKQTKFTFFNLLYVGCILSLLISNYVISTFFSKEMLFGWIFIGINLAFASKKIAYRI